MPSESVVDLSTQAKRIIDVIAGTPKNTEDRIYLEDVAVIVAILRELLQDSAADNAKLQSELKEANEKIEKMKLPLRNACDMMFGVVDRDGARKVYNSVYGENLPMENIIALAAGSQDNQKS